MEKQMINKKSILIVDDEYGIRDILDFYFKDGGWNVTTASNGNEACSILAQASFDVILSDIQMPGLNGVELLKRIKDQTPLSAVILMTGFSKYTMEELLALGAEKVFNKPFSLEEITCEIFQVYKSKVLMQ